MVGVDLVVHFAVDEQEVRFCTRLNGKGSWFLPFNLDSADRYRLYLAC
jgi:hypothetical protein